MEDCKYSGDFCSLQTSHLQALLFELTPFKYCQAQEEDRGGSGRERREEEGREGGEKNTDFLSTG